MNLARTLIVGIGSPHGDDQVGWLVADQLAGRLELNHVEVRRAASPADLLDWLEGVKRLVICDACHGLPCLGDLRRWNWPTSEMPGMSWSGTHDLSLPTVLALAQRLGHLPKHVVVWGIEGAIDTEVLSRDVADAVPRLVRRIELELNGQVPAEDARCTNSRS